MVLVTGVVAVAAVIIAGTAFIMDGDDGGANSFTVKYYNNGNKISERTVSAEPTVSILVESIKDNGSGRFIGWNTESDLSGKTIQPGSKLTVDRDISLHAMFANSGRYAIIVPDKQEGFTVTADPIMVDSGGSAIVTYNLMPSHVEKDFVISVNGNPMKLDALGRLHLFDITEDRVITVAGVYDKREHSITLPEEQIGYVLYSSDEKVHDKQSYTLEYRLLPGYRTTSEFGIRINGGGANIPYEGVLAVEDVRDNHVITVTGIEPIPYGISSGKNVKVLVNGTAASTATVEDLITVTPAAGYTLPSTFNAQIKGKYSLEAGKYRPADNISFPSVLKINAGDNIKMNNSGSVSIFVCPGDVVSISASAGYSLPKNYADAVMRLNGVSSKAGGYSFSDDSVLPSIYRVVFNGYNKVHETSYVVEGDKCPIPVTEPEKEYYRLLSWQIVAGNIFANTTINAIWAPIEYTVSFGSNIHYMINDISYSQPGEYTVTVEDVIYIEACVGFRLPDGYLPQSVFIKQGARYTIVSDYSLPDILCVTYFYDIENVLSKKYYYSSNEIHTIVNPRTQVTPAFTFDLDGTGYEISDFRGWTFNGQLYTGGTITVTEHIMFVPSWE